MFLYEAMPLPYISLRPDVCNDNQLLEQYISDAEESWRVTTCRGDACLLTLIQHVSLLEAAYIEQ